MPLILTEEQTLLQDAADGFLKEHAPIAHLRQLRDSRDPDGVSRDLWRAFGEMGFSGVVIPEEDGGSGLGAVEAGVIAEGLGRTLTPSPFMGSSVLAATVLKTAGSEAQKAWLAKIAAGEAILSLAVDEGPKHAPAKIATRAERSGNGFKLNGAKGFVLDGHVADALIVAAQTDEGLTLFLIDPATPGVSVERTVMVDAHNAARVTLSEVQVDADAVVGAVGEGTGAAGRRLDAGPRLRCFVAGWGRRSGVQDHPRLSENPQAIRQAYRRVSGSPAPRRPPVHRAGAGQGGHPGRASGHRRGPP